MIQVTDITKIYGTGGATVHAVDHVSFTLGEGQFGLLCGASGSGKSTLLSMCGGLLRPEAGEIVVGGENLTQMKPEALAAYRLKRAGYIFQDFNLMKNLTLEENIALPAMIAGRKSYSGNLRELAERVGITGRLLHFPEEVSGGERQRCAIARALINSPSLLLADEPTGNLDADNAAQIVRLLLEINRAGTTVLMVTHDVGLRDYIRENAPSPLLLNMRDGRIYEKIG
ncbi:MAG: ABC transporter ATP-binding protein [Clostridia bacterium]|nr:ABC transporter ATP-binding protein [Clostridia bacterium]